MLGEKVPSRDGQARYPMKKLQPGASASSELLAGLSRPPEWVKMTASIPHTRNAPPAATGLPVPRGRMRAGRVAWLALALVLAATGCKSSKGGGGGGDLTQSDPLMGGSRIPPTSVPVPERNGLGNSRTRTDPLLGSPTGNTKKDPKSNTGATRTEDPDRWKGPFVPSQATTTAALTAKLRSDHSDLTIDEPPADANRGARLQLASGTAPIATNSQNFDQIPQVLQDDLSALGIRRGAYEIVKLPSGEFAMRAKVPTKSGGVTQYEEVGPTAAAAVQKLIDQIKSDRP
jgi:hypothetical protein